MTVPRFDLNHPKSYIGYALALKYTKDRDRADEVFTEHVIAAPDMARRGAQHLGLVNQERTQGRYEYSVTDHGHSIVEKAIPALSATSTKGALNELRTLVGARERFVDSYPALADIGLEIAYGNDGIETIVDTIRDYQERTYHEQLNVVGLTKHLWEHDPEFAVEAMIRDDDAVRTEVLGDPIPDEWDNFSNGLALVERTVEIDGEYKSVFRSSTTFQLKNLLWHLGIVTEKGTQARELAPGGDIWAVEPWIVDPSVTATDCIGTETEV